MSTTSSFLNNKIRANLCRLLTFSIQARQKAKKIASKPSLTSRLCFQISAPGLSSLLPSLHYHVFDCFLLAPSRDNRRSCYLYDIPDNPDVLRSRLESPLCPWLELFTPLGYEAIHCHIRGHTAIIGVLHPGFQNARQLRHLPAFTL